MHTDEKRKLVDPSEFRPSESFGDRSVSGETGWMNLARGKVDTLV